MLDLISRGSSSAMLGPRRRDESMKGGLLGTRFGCFRRLGDERVKARLLNLGVGESAYVTYPNSVTIVPPST